MEGLERILGEHRLFAGLGQEFIDLAAGCAKNTRFNADEYLFHAEDPADWIYLVRHGRVALELAAPGRGAVQFETVGEGEIVGLTWLLPPYRWGYDARALELTRAIALDARCLRDKCEADHRPRLRPAEALPAGAGAAAAGHPFPDAGRLWTRSLNRCRAGGGRRWCRASCGCGSARANCPAHVTLELESADGAPLPRYRPGQFTMMYVFGVGEIPVSISGDAADASRLVQTIRSVGAVSEAVTALKPGDLLGLRGPFGTAWPTEELAGQDVVVVAGGLGLAPLRPSIYHLLANRAQFGKVVLLYGTRSPEEILYRRQLETWRRRLDVQIEVTVDHAGSDWRGNVGVVTRLIPKLAIDVHARDGAGLRPGGDDALRRRGIARHRHGGRRRSGCRSSAT